MLMNVTIRKGVVFAVACFVTANGVCQKVGGQVSVDARVSRMTDWAPEIQLMLHNKGRAPVPFFVNALSTTCKSSDSAESIRSLMFGARETLSSFGVVPGHSWAHRTLLSTESGFHAGCTALVTLSFGDEYSSKRMLNVQIPTANMILPEEHSKPAPSITVDANFERDRFRGYVLMRARVRNTGSAPVVVVLSDHRIKCKGEYSPAWAAGLYEVLQGLRTGPDYLAPSDWTVFTDSIRLGNHPESALDSCFVELEVSEVADPGFKTISITKVPVKISGYLSQRAPQ